ncbi:MAG: aminotransferase class V-fold PLP-dependent enzyme [Cyclobacteriaceae bacterium]
MMETTLNQTSLENHFQSFRKGIVGQDATFVSPYGSKKIIYADWTASGRLYKPIEEKISHDIGPFVANTHTEITFTGSTITNAYHKAHQIIKDHVNASDEDVILTGGSGMTGAVNKLHRILGLRVPERFQDQVNIEAADRPIVFVTHMEHHSNHTSWLETIADVECIVPDEDGRIDLAYLDNLLVKYQERKLKIASVTACSNVTGIRTCYPDVARLMHRHGGLCFVDFACSAPYDEIDMHPQGPEEALDAIYFSPHKFLGGPGSSGVLIFHSSLYHNKTPDNPGGGTVNWTNPWGGRQYIDDIATREDGGTPAFLQTIKVALAIKLKEEMGVRNIQEREDELVKLVFDKLRNLSGLHLLAEHREDRLGVFSFNIDGMHHDLVCQILNDRFGIQTRSGCSCAGTYGHYLLHISKQKSREIIDELEHDHYLKKPGWVRMSIHPTMTDDEINFILDSIIEIVEHVEEMSKDYTYVPDLNKFVHNTSNVDSISPLIEDWFG